MSIVAMQKRAPALAPVMPALEERIKLRNQLVRRNEFNFVGKLRTIMFDLDGLPGGANVFQKNMLCWESEYPNQPNAFPWLGISTDEQELLIVSPVPHPPDIRDTSQIVLTDAGYRAVKREQRYRDRTQSKLKNSGFLVIQPVTQMLYKPVNEAELALMRISTGFDGTQMAFLIDPNTGEGHFIGGRFEIDRRVRRGQPYGASL